MRKRFKMIAIFLNRWRSEQLTMLCNWNPHHNHIQIILAIRSTGFDTENRPQTRVAGDVFEQCVLYIS